MTALNEKIYHSIQQLPSALQEELFDFVQYLLLKAERQERAEWAALSLTSAMRGMEHEEPLYDLSDLKVTPLQKLHLTK
jgi:Protein of unknown function (DUF2281).